MPMQEIDLPDEDILELAQNWANNFNDSGLNLPFGIPAGVLNFGRGIISTSPDLNKAVNLMNSCFQRALDFRKDNIVNVDLEDFWTIDDSSKKRSKADTFDEISYQEKSLYALTPDVYTAETEDCTITWFNYSRPRNAPSEKIRRVRLSKGQQTGKLRARVSSKSVFGESLGLLVGSILTSAGSNSVDAELTAHKQLLTVLSKAQIASYILCGSFIEESTRSGVTYIFRKGRPTIAIRAVTRKEGTVTTTDFVFLAALCCHPGGYFEDTFVGVLPPSDEVYANLLLLRADEHGYWKRSIQHPIHHPQSGV